MTQRLFQRAWRVQVGPFASEDLDCAFKVERTTSARPGTCELTLWGLSASQRAEILAMPRRSPFGGATGATAPQTIVQLSAGYEGATRPMIFQGNLRRARQKREHPEWTIELSASDGTYALHSARAARAFSADASLSRVVRDLADQMGVGHGNVQEATASLEGLGRVGALFPEGHVLHGPASAQMTALCRAAGMEWSVQSGVLQLVPRGQARGRTAILLSDDTGLVGSPETNGRYKAKARCLMIAGLSPGCLVELRTSVINGTYRVGHMTLSGDTRGQDWGAELDLTSLEHYENMRLFR